MPSFKVGKRRVNIGLKAFSVQYAPAGGGPTRPAGSTTDTSNSTAQASYTTAITNAHTNSLVYATLDFIARNAVTTPMVLARVERNGDLEVIEEHELLDLLAQGTLDPDPTVRRQYLAGKQLLNVSTWGVYLSRQGSAFWHKDRNSTRRVVGLTYLPHKEVAIQATKTHIITGYKYTPEGASPIEYQPEDIVHLRLGPDPFNLHLGRCPLASLGRWLAIDDSGGSWTAALLRNRAIPGLTMSVKPGIDPLNEDQMEKVKAHAEAEFAGANRGKTAFVGIPMDMHQMGFDPSQMDLSTLCNTAEERVTAVLGVPASVVGFGTGLEQTKVGATLDA